jgi:hypothetical protein
MPSLSPVPLLESKVGLALANRVVGIGDFY